MAYQYCWQTFGLQSIAIAVAIRPVTMPPSKTAQRSCCLREGEAPAESAFPWSAARREPCPPNAQGPRAIQKRKTKCGVKAIKTQDAPANERRPILSKCR